MKYTKLLLIMVSSFFVGCSQNTADLTIEKPKYRDINQTDYNQGVIDLLYNFNECNAIIRRHTK